MVARWLRHAWRAIRCRVGRAPRFAISRLSLHVDPLVSIENGVNWIDAAHLIVVVDRRVALELPAHLVALGYWLPLPLSVALRGDDADVDVALSPAPPFAAELRAWGTAVALSGEKQMRILTLRRWDA